MSRTLPTWNGVPIITRNVYPPIPDRSMDWEAVTANYDVCCEECGANEPEGRGATEMQAVCDLVEQLMEA